MFESIYVVVLFLLYIFLWELKARKQKKSSGIDPMVFEKSTTSVQRYINQLIKFMTFYVVLVIAFHISGIQFFSFFSRFPLIDDLFWTNHIGFCVGCFGLLICFYAQQKMGSSWRVGIDEDVKTELITSGIYRYIRNPTYLGLFLLNVGVWIILPTWTVAILVLMFCFILDFQVRCEEDFLEGVHGKTYNEYKKNSKRYLPFIY